MLRWAAYVALRSKSALSSQIQQNNDTTSNKEQTLRRCAVQRAVVSGTHNTSRNFIQEEQKMQRRAFKTAKAQTTENKSKC